MNDRKWSRERLGHDFRDPGLLARALTHRSLGPDNLERLEFLGDRVLGLVIARQIYDIFPDEPEGALTRRFHQLVSRQACAAIARDLGVPGQVRLNAQARADGGAESDNILGDVLEALIGAVFIDGGSEAAQAVVLKLWAGRLHQLETSSKHPKSALQEWALARGLRPPAYQLLRRTGPHHAPTFDVRLTVGALPAIESSGPSKQEAETAAARRFLEELADGD
jgi:ribonuclease-3